MCPCDRTPLDESQLKETIVSFKNLLNKLITVCDNNKPYSSISSNTTTVRCTWKGQWGMLRDHIVKDCPLSRVSISSNYNWCYNISILFSILFYSHSILFLFSSTPILFYSIRLLFYIPNNCSCISIYPSAVPLRDQLYWTNYSYSIDPGTRKGCSPCPSSNRSTKVWMN